MIQKSHTWGYIQKKANVQNDACARTFIAALLTIAKTWKPSTRPWIREWIKKMWYLDTAEYYSTVNKIVPQAATWLDLVNIIQSEVSQKENDKST